MLDPGDEKVLVLGPFQGAPTEHVRIPVTEGVCGAAVAQGETVIVEDVSACGMVKSPNGALTLSGRC
jgi:L-methionine (R)-S-oxide reductase